MKSKAESEKVKLAGSDPGSGPGSGPGSDPGVKSQKKITLECFWCDVLLQFNEQHGFYKCPDCGGEWWPGPSDPEYGITTLWNDEQAYKRSISKPGGGSRRAGKKRQKNIKKKLITERYELE